MADVTLDPANKEMSDLVSAESGSIFITNQEMEEGSRDLARLIILLKTKRETSPATEFDTKELSTGVLVTWRIDKDYKPSASGS